MKSSIQMDDLRGTRYFRKHPHWDKLRVESGLFEIAGFGLGLPAQSQTIPNLGKSPGFSKWGKKNKSWNPLELLQCFCCMGPAAGCNIHMMCDENLRFGKYGTGHLGGMIEVYFWGDKSGK